MVQKGKIVEVIFNEANYEDKVKLNIDNSYEIVKEGDEYFAKKVIKPKKSRYSPLPKKPYDCNLKSLDLSAFRVLIQCRNAYWELANNWKPNWESTEKKYSIYNYRGQIRADYFTVVDRCILVFPEEQMRNEFYENFKDLIEECKEWL